MVNHSKPAESTGNGRTGSERASVQRPARLGALFVDFENIYLSFRDVVAKPLEMTLHVLTRLCEDLTREHSITVVLGRAYASWEYGAARDALSHLSLLGIVPQYVLSRPQKSSADLKLSIDLMEVLLTRADISCFVIAGGDRDYMPIVEKIKERAKHIFIVSPAAATSGDLISLVGEHSFMDAMSMLPEDAQPAPPVLPVRAVPPSGMDGTGGAESSSVQAPTVEVSPKEPAESAGRAESAPGSAAEPQRPHASPPATVSVEPADEARAEQKLRRFMHEFSIQDLWSCVGLILRAQGEIKNSEIWVGPFLKNYMNEEFHFMNNAQRKRLLAVMEDVGAVSVMEKPDRMGEQTYSILMVNWDSPVIKVGLFRDG
jgi:uncharacterized LabA/DUF88 family protein